MYAGIKKVGNDIDKRLKKEISSAKSNERRKALNKATYYLKLKQKSK
jgi:hypothetical protein